MRSSRLLSILLLLQTRGRMTAQALADELEVSVRTVYRDVEALSAAGVPVFSDRGPAGGYQLVDGYRTRLTGLTPAEAETLFLAGVPGPAAELGLGTVLAAAQLKLLAALPPELRTRAGRVRERFHLDAPGWFQEADQPNALADIADAVWNERLIRIRYRRWGTHAGEREQPGWSGESRQQEVERTLEPLGLVLKSGAWYLVARVDGQDRAYRVGRILGVDVLNEHFERPGDFDLAAFWQSWLERFEASLYHAKATVRLSPRALALVPHVFDPAVVRAAAETAGLPDADGWVQAVIPIESIQHAERSLLRLGPDAEVLAPLALRARMIEQAQALVRLYRAGADV